MCRRPHCTTIGQAPQRPRTVNFIYGLGGRDLTLEEGRRLVRRLKAIADTGKVESHYDYLQVRE